MQHFLRDLENSLHKSFIDKTYAEPGRYQPKLLVNNTKHDENVLNTISNELETCQSFIFSVAFITESGLATLKAILLDLKQRGVKGRILTSTYLYFNQPKMFRELLKLDHVETRLTALKGFHSKGYIFEQDTHYSLIVGSSNLTAHALKVNYEWNIKLNSHENGEVVDHFKNQFEEIWEVSHQLTNEWITAYQEEYQENNKKTSFDMISDVQNPSFNPLKKSLEVIPNQMQTAALAQIEALRDTPVDKALVISATGTGKTYLSAFDVRNFRPKRMLFIVHREQILTQAKEDFKRVLGETDDNIGLFTGHHNQYDRKYVFATIQTLSKNLNIFNPSDFDYILIDEVHKAGAPSYVKVIDYFKPKFLLGMTATPERTDDFNIYELFDYNIAYEIRLQEALEADMLCPFHYFGVTDFELDGELIDDTAQLAQLVTKERVDHIIEKVNYYGHAGDKVRGLIFCSRREEAKELEIALNNRGLVTKALSGENSPAEREDAINNLEDGILDYIITVDIFNEGIDIPSINQILMLRQTQSSIIFIQQLGRGLRKHDSKDYVTIIDFIGNYKNNYLIPIALSGDNSQNKDNIRRYLKNTNFIQGVSTINFEAVAKKKIYESINKNNLTTLKILKDAYTNLKNKIGRIPYLTDFITNHSIDPLVIIDKHHHLHKFLLKMEKDMPLITNYESSVLHMLSAEILNGKRQHEIILLQSLLAHKTISHCSFIEKLQAENCFINDDTFKSLQRIFDLSFYSVSHQKKYGNQPIIIFDGETYRFNKFIQNSLEEDQLFKDLLYDVINAASLRSERYLNDQPLTLYEKYSRKDVCRLLNWNSDESSTMYGYKTKHGTCPIFITYHKDDEVESSINYNDEFLTPSLLRWYTRSNRTLKSKEVNTILQAEENDIDIHLFVKKDDDEGIDFYYLGKGIPNVESAAEDTMRDKNNKEIPVVHMDMHLKYPVEDKIGRYLLAK